jgi:hypothetical protein
MPQARDEEGNIWEVDAQGNPVALIKAANSAPADPTFETKGPQAKANLQNTEDTILDRLINRQLSEDEFELKLAKDGFMRDPATGRIVRDPNFVDPDKKEKPEKNIAKDLQADSALGAIRNARILAQKSMATGNTFGTAGFGYVPILGQNNANLGAKISGLQGGIINDMLAQLKELSATGSSGYGSLSETEGARIAASIAALDQMQEGPELVAELDRLEKHYLNGKALLNGDDPRLPEVQKKYGIGQQQADKTNRFTDTGEQRPQYELGIPESEQTDQDKKYGALVQAAFDRGASANELRQMATQYGYTDRNYGQDLEAAIKYRDGGGKGAILTAPSSGYNDPGIIERARQSVGSGPVGGYFGGAANGLSLGFMDEVQGAGKTALHGGDLGENIAEANLVKGIQAEANPWTNLAGNVTGGALGALATGGVTGGLAAGGARALAGDALLGITFGAGENNDNRAGGAAIGALAGAGGGYAGRKAGNALGGLVGGSSNADAQLLRQRGINQMTPGQIRGGAAAEAEMRRAVVPGGVPIQNAQKRGLQQFNQAGFDEGLAPIGKTTTEIGERGVEQAKVAGKEGYGFLNNENLSMDPQIVRALAGRNAEAGKIPNLGETTQFSIQKAIGDFISPAGNVTGKGFQNINQNLTKRAGLLENNLDAVGPDAAAVLRGAKDDFGDMAERQIPELMPQLRNANQAFGNVQILRDAVSSGKNTNGMYMPSQLTNAAEKGAKKYGGKHATTDRPFFDLSRAGQNVLASKLPNSGTPGALLSDGIFNQVKAAMKGASNRVVYNEDVLKLINAMALDRPDIMRAAGEGIKKRSRLGGIFGAPAATLPLVD